MGNINIVCETQAFFVSKNMDKFHYTFADVGKVVEAPDWIQGTMLYKILCEKGKMKIVKEKEADTSKTAKKAEISADDLEGTNGADTPVNEESDIPCEEPAPSKSTRKSDRSKKDDVT